jgi:phospholipid/cholesterol/gamma-HCH transport system substrate-binding protein
MFVLASIVVLSVLMVWFGEAPDWLGVGDWTLEITGVGEIRGIGDGAPVLLNGVEIGRVAGLDFEDREIPGRGVVIRAMIKRDYSVPRGATAKVYGSMFGLGTGQVNICVEPGPTPAPVDKEGDARIHGEMGSMIREFIPEEFTTSFHRTVDQIGNLAAAAEPVAENLAQLLEERRVADVDGPGPADQAVTANLATLIERLDALAANVNTVLGDENLQEDLKGVARDLKDASEEMWGPVELWKHESQSIADHVKEGIERTDENLSRSIAKATEVAEHLDEGAKTAAAVGQQVTRGEGTIGKLVYDDRLYEAGVLALQRLTKVLDRLERITGKIEQDGYITVGRETPVGTFTKKFPVNTQATDQ